MKHLPLAILITFAGLSVGVAADRVDKRIAEVRKAYIEPIDDLGDDMAVAKCVAQHLPDQTPMVIVPDKDGADVILRVKAHLPGSAMRTFMGESVSMAGAQMSAWLPGEESPAWESGKSGVHHAERHQALRGTKQDIYCGLADELIERLLNSMRKARGQQ